MTDGSIRMRVRAAVAGYMLLRWSVDALPDYSLKDEQYRHEDEVEEDTFDRFIRNGQYPVR